MLCTSIDSPFSYRKFLACESDPVIPRNPPGHNLHASYHTRATLPYSSMLSINIPMRVKSKHQTSAKPDSTKATAPCLPYTHTLPSSIQSCLHLSFSLFAICLVIDLANYGPSMSPFPIYIYKVRPLSGNYDSTIVHLSRKMSITTATTAARDWGLHEVLDEDREAAILQEQATPSEKEQSKLALPKPKNPPVSLSGAQPQPSVESAYIMNGHPTLSNILQWSDDSARQPEIETDRLNPLKSMNVPGVPVEPCFTKKVRTLIRRGDVHGLSK